METKEKEIILYCQKGELARFGELYEKYIKKIYDFVYYKTHHQELAEDLVSHIFIKALENINKFSLEKGTFQAWLYQIARNTVIDHYRTRKQEKDIEDVWDLAGDSDLEKDIDTKNKLEKIEKYLSGLKSEQRDIVIMKLWQEMSHIEIAEIMGKTEASVKMSFSRTIRQLRKDMPAAVFLSLLIFGM